MADEKMQSESAARVSATNDSGSETFQKLERVQRTRKLILMLALLAAAALLAVSRSWAPAGGFLHEGLKFAGVLLIFSCIAGRLWSSLYVAGRKKLELVQVGPYSISRNPLYLFSIIGAAGIGAQTGSLTVLIAAGLICAGVFSSVIAKEEVFLRGRFGAEFDAYCARTPRLLPNLSNLRTAPERTINPQLIMRNFRDSAMFLLAVPAIAVIKLLQDTGWLPVWFVLP